MFLYDTINTFEIWHPFYVLYIIWIVGMGLFQCLIASPEARSVVREGLERDPLILAAGCLMGGSLFLACYAPFVMATLPLALVGMMGMPWQGAVVLYGFGVFWLVIVSRFYQDRTPPRMA
jgi:hypothetical protein